jgi:hypothetical protein
MNPNLTYAVAKAHIAELRAQAQTDRLAHDARAKRRSNRARSFSRIRFPRRKRAADAAV